MEMDQGKHSNLQTSVIDPVCGMTVNPATSRFKTTHNGKEYFFCCQGCLDKFGADPEKILAGPPKAMVMPRVSGSGLVSLGAPVPRTGEGAPPSTSSAVAISSAIDLGRRTAEAVAQ